MELALKQKWLVPIAPQGLVELSKFCKAEGLPSGAIDLSVMIQHGKGLKRRFIGTPTLWVDCLVAKKPGTSFQTSKIKAMDAAWQEEWQIKTHDGGFELGDTLEFKVMDKETEMATGRLVSQQVFPYGYDDFLPLSQAGTSLRLTISYAGQLRRPPEKRQSRMKRASTFSMGDSVVVAAKAPGKDVGQDEETMSDPGRKTSKTSEATADAQDEPAKESSRRTKLLTKIGIIGETETRKRANTDSAALKAEQRRQTQPLKAHAPLRAAPRVKVADPDSD